MAVPYTSSAALQVLPSGGTRLHRALLKADTEATLAWLGAGADPWMLSASLPNNFMARHWPTRSSNNSPDRLSGISLLALTLVKQDWSRFQGIFEKLDFSERPYASDGNLLEAVIRNPRAPAALMETLLRRGLDLPSSTYQSEDLFLSMAPSQRQMWIDAKGWDYLSKRLPGLAQKALSDSFSSPPVKEVLKWLDQGLILDDPQAVLIAWSHRARRMEQEVWSAGICALTARGAHLDQYAGDSEECWTPLAATFLYASPDQLQFCLDRCQRTVLDESGPAGGETCVAQIVRRSINGGIYTYEKLLDNALLRHDVNLDQTGQTATGVRHVLSVLPENSVGSMNQNQNLFLIQTQRWLDWAIRYHLPDTGQEAGKHVSAFDLWWKRLLHVVDPKSGISINGNLVESSVRAWGNYAQIELLPFMQGEFYRLARAKLPGLSKLLPLFAQTCADPWQADAMGLTPWVALTPDDRLTWYRYVFKSGSLSSFFNTDSFASTQKFIDALTAKRGLNGNPFSMELWLSTRPVSVGNPVTLLQIFVEVVSPDVVRVQATPDQAKHHEWICRLEAEGHEFTRSEAWVQLRTHVRESLLTQMPSIPSRRLRPRG